MKLRCGYRRPNNLRETLVRAAIPYRIGDEKCDPEYKGREEQNQRAPTTPQGEVLATEKLENRQNKALKQRSILDFVKRQNVSEPSTSKVEQTSTNRVDRGINPKVGTSKKERGFNFCNRRGCRYCPLLNRTGDFQCNVTKAKFTSMKNISCRSSNLIYAITCTRCRKQYVGQTLLRLKDRFKHHLYDIEIGDKQKAVGLHFSRFDHNGWKDVEISVLEFIKKPPRSPEAVKIRDRVEKKWIHLLRSPAPLGLNIFD
jgi:hypothetical protein